MQREIKLDLMKKVLERFDWHIPIPTEALEELVSLLKKGTFRRGELIVKPSTDEKKWYFVEKGLLRAYYYRGDTQVTVMFISEGSCVSVFDKYYAGLNSGIYLEAIEPTVLYSLDKEDGNRMRDTYPGIAELHRRILARFLLLFQKHLDLLKFESAEERYLRLMNCIPQLLLRIPSIYVASYLGITSETLSRVRGRLTGREKGKGKIIG